MILLMIGALTDKPASRMPAIYTAKYNRFVDNILVRMNKILRVSYDPVSVRLQPVEPKKKNKKSKSKKTKSGKKKNGAR